jgi:hypothetical protein
MKLDRIVQSILAVLVISSLISMFFLFRIDGIVKGLVNNGGVQLSADWLGPYSKLTLYVFVLILFNAVIAMCGLFFRRQPKREISQLESELRHEETMQQEPHQPAEEQERASASDSS